MNQVFSGPVGSGKTTALKNKYMELITGGVKSDSILVLARSTPDVSLWRRELKAPVTGKLNIFTYFGFVQNQLTAYWPLIEAILPVNYNYSQPVFMTVEASHYLMTELVEKKAEQGGFKDVKSTSGDIAIQLIDNLNQAAVSGIPLEDACLRLRMLGAAGDSVGKAAAYNDAVEVMKQFRNNCLQSQGIDYSLAVELYTNYLYKDERYIKTLDSRYRYIIVDDLEETVPAAQDLIVHFLKSAEEVFLGYNARGGHTDFFGAYPEGAERNILPLCTVNELDKESAKDEIRDFADGLADLISGRPVDIRNSTPLKGQIIAEMRGAMLEETAENIKLLIRSGTNPGDIAVVAPLIDKVLEFDITSRLAAKGIEVASVNRSRRLLDQPFAQAMVTLAVIVNRQWEIPLNYSAVVQCMCLLLELDPIRSAVLAEKIIKNGNSLPDVDEAGLRHRLGYRNAEKYQDLCEWVERRNAEGTHDLRLLFQQVFAELLAPLSPGEEDLLAVRQVLDSAVKLHKALGRYYGGSNAEDIDRRFIDLVQKGTLAADMLYRPPVNKNKVILTTPLNFILNPNIAKVDYQFWIDIAGRQWMRGIAKELANPWVLSRRWGEGQVWDDMADQRVKINTLARLIRALLGKCKKGIYTAHSHLSSQGWEQDGILLDVFEVVKERGQERND